MTNKSKNKGTWGETRVVLWLKNRCAFTHARRNVLGGSNDPGDVEPVPKDPPPIIISVKNGYGGVACPTCNHIRDIHPETAQFKDWWSKLTAVARRRNPNALTLLVVKRAGKTDPEHWHWYVHSSHVGSDHSLGVVKVTGAQARLIMHRYCANYGVDKH